MNATPDFPALLMNPDSLTHIITALELAEKGKGFYDLVRSRNEKKFYRKVGTFLLQLKGISEQQKIEFLKKLNENSTDFWDNILRTLEKINEERKAAITGKLCEALILEFLDKRTFARLCQVIESVFIDDLEFFGLEYSKMPSTEELMNTSFIPSVDKDKLKIDQLVVHGLLTDNRIISLQHGSSVPSVAQHKPTELGEQLLKFGFK